MKKMITLALVAAMTLSVMLCAVSCDDATGKESGTESQTESASVSETSSETTSESVSEEASTEAESTKVSYTVTVKNEEGTPVAGVEIQVCVGDICKKPRVTNDEGVVVFNIDHPGDEELKLQINGGPEGYEYLGADGKILVDADQSEITVTLKAVA